MLILTRRIGEVIHIANDISVQVVSIQGQQAKLGISAPAKVTIFRGELAEPRSKHKKTSRYTK